MLCAFTVGFQKVNESCLLLTSRSFSRCKGTSLKVPAMIFFDLAKKVRDTEKFSLHTMTDVTFIVLFSQE